MGLLCAFSTPEALGCGARGGFRCHEGVWFPFLRQWVRGDVNVREWVVCLVGSRMMRGRKRWMIQKFWIDEQWRKVCRVMRGTCLGRVSTPVQATRQSWQSRSHTVLSTSWPICNSLSVSLNPLHWRVALLSRTFGWVSRTHYKRGRITVKRYGLRPTLLFNEADEYSLKQR